MFSTLEALKWLLIMVTDTTMACLFAVFPLCWQFLSEAEFGTLLAGFCNVDTESEDPSSGPSATISQTCGHEQIFRSVWSAVNVKNHLRSAPVLRPRGNHIGWGGGSAGCCPSCRLNLASSGMVNEVNSKQPTTGVAPPFFFSFWTRLSWNLQSSCLRQGTE